MGKVKNSLVSAVLAFSLLGACDRTSRLKSGSPASESFPTCSSISVGTVTFSFSRPVSCGNFANGDKWVSPNGLSFQITRMTPDYVAGPIKLHGYAINPPVRVLVSNPDYPMYTSNPFLDSIRNSFDSRPGNFVAPQELPIVIPANLTEPLSIVKVQSDVPANPLPNCERQDANGTVIRNCIYEAAILTVMPTPSTDYANRFRPHPYRSGPSEFSVASAPNFSAPKTAYLANPNWAGIPSLPPPSFSPISVALASNPCEGRGQFWFGKEYGAGVFHPSRCTVFWAGSGGTPAPTGYHAYIPYQMLLLRAMHSDAGPYRNQMLYGLFQYAIDLYAVMQSGYEPVSAGGHHIGFKYLILLTGHFLNIPEMKNIGFTHTLRPYQSPSQTPQERIFSDDGIAYDAWDTTSGQNIPVYGNVCPLSGQSSYEFNMLSGNCQLGSKFCRAVSTPTLMSLFPTHNPEVHATDGGCVEQNGGRPVRSMRQQFGDWLSGGTVTTPSEYQDWYQYNIPYAAIVWLLGLESSYNYTPVLKYMWRLNSCYPWRQSRPQSTWNATSVYYANWFLDNYLPSNLYPCPIW